MASLNELKAEVDKITGDQASQFELPKISSQEMAREAQEEIENRDVIITTAHYHTMFMQDVISPVIQKFLKWKGDIEELKSRIERKKAEFAPASVLKELEKIEAEKKQDIDSIAARYENNELGNAKRDLNDAEATYERLRKINNNNPPKNIPLWYLPVMIFIGVGEWLLNYETFSVKFGVEFMAIGMTLLVAVSFALASHFHGEFIKQRVHQVGATVDSPKRLTHIIIQLVSTVLFLTSITAVVLTRYYVIQDQLGNVQSDISLPGQNNSGIEQSVMQLLLPTVLLNAAVYLLGVLISYVVHDPIPGYQRAKRDLERARKRRDKVRSRLTKEQEAKEKEYEKEFDEQNSIHEDDRREAKACDELLDQIEIKTRTVTNRLLSSVNRFATQYQSVLITVGKQYADPDLTIGPDAESLSAYRARNIELTEEQLNAY